MDREMPDSKLDRSPIESADKQKLDRKFDRAGQDKSSRSEWLRNDTNEMVPRCGQEQAERDRTREWQKWDRKLDRGRTEDGMAAEGHQRDAAKMGRDGAKMRPRWDKMGPR